MILIGSVAFLWGFTATARAEDRAVTPVSDEPQGIQISVVKGKLVVTNTAPNSPVVLSPAPVREAPDPMPSHIQKLVNSISKTHGVDPRLVAAVMQVESNFNRWATSSKGALGLMQLIPATGRRFGVQDFFDPEQNIEGGVRYLKFLSQKFGAGNIDLQLAAYNAGENLVERLGRIPPIQETVDYVRKVKKLYKPELGLTLVSASDKETATSAEPAAAPAPAPVLNAPDVIYRHVDEHGITRFSNVGPPN
jgi:soluble lytic murein transglycosylase-like protein